MLPWGDSRADLQSCQAIPGRHCQMLGRLAPEARHSVPTDWWSTALRYWLVPHGSVWKQTGVAKWSPAIGPSQLVFEAEPAEFGQSPEIGLVQLTVGPALL